MVFWASCAQQAEGGQRFTKLRQSCVLGMSKQTFPSSDSSQRDTGIPSPSQIVTLPWNPLHQVSCIQPALLVVAPECPSATCLLRDEEGSVGMQEMLILLGGISNVISSAA